jgi:CcmD family protein
MTRLTLLLTALLMFSVELMGQNDAPDFMRSIGKIYVVVAVIIAIFIGIVLFLIYLDRKLTKLENQINDND